MNSIKSTNLAKEYENAYSFNMTMANENIPSSNLFGESAANSFVNCFGTGWGYVVQKDANQGCLVPYGLAENSVYCLVFTAEMCADQSTFQAININDHVVYMTYTDRNGVVSLSGLQKMDEQMSASDAGMINNMPSNVITYDTEMSGVIFSLLNKKTTNSSLNSDKSTDQPDGVISYHHDTCICYLPFNYSDVSFNEAPNKRLRVHDQVKFLIEHNLLSQEMRAVNIQRIASISSTTQYNVKGRLLRLDKENRSGFLERLDTSEQVFFSFKNVVDPDELKINKECIFNVRVHRNGRVEAKYIRITNSENTKPGGMQAKREECEDAQLQHGVIIQDCFNEEKGKIYWKEGDRIVEFVGESRISTLTTLYPGDEVTFEVSGSDKNLTVCHLQVASFVKAVAENQIFNTTLSQMKLGQNPSPKAPRFQAWTLKSVTNDSSTDGLALLRSFDSCGGFDSMQEKVECELAENASAEWHQSLKQFIWCCASIATQKNSNDMQCILQSLEELKRLENEKRDATFDYQIVSLQKSEVCNQEDVSLFNFAQLEIVEANEPPTQGSVAHYKAIRIHQVPSLATPHFLIREGVVTREASDRSLRHKNSSCSQEDDDSCSVTAPLPRGNLGIIHFANCPPNKDTDSRNNAMANNSVFYSFSTVGKAKRRPRIGEKVTFTLLEITPNLRFATNVIRTDFLVHDSNESLPIEPVDASVSLNTDSSRRSSGSPSDVGILKSNRSTPRISVNSDANDEDCASVDSGCDADKVDAVEENFAVKSKSPAQSLPPSAECIQVSVTGQDRQRGWIVFLGRSFGFIESEDHMNCLYFPFTMLKSQYDSHSITLGQEVNFKQAISPANNQLMAKDVRLEFQPIARMPPAQPGKLMHGRIVKVAGKNDTNGNRSANGLIEEVGSCALYWYSHKSQSHLGMFLQHNDIVTFSLADCAADLDAVSRVDPKRRGDWAVNINSDMPRFLGRVSRINSKHGTISFQLNDFLSKSLAGFDINSLLVSNDTLLAMSDTQFVPKIRARPAPHHSKSSKEVEPSNRPLTNAPTQFSEPWTWDSADKLSAESLAVNKNEIEGKPSNSATKYEIVFPLSANLLNSDERPIEEGDLVTFQICIYSSGLLVNSGGRPNSVASKSPTLSVTPLTKLNEVMAKSSPGINVMLMATNLQRFLIGEN